MRRTDVFLLMAVFLLVGCGQKQQGAETHAGESTAFAPLLPEGQQEGSPGRASGAQSVPSPGPEVGGRAPNFALADVEGRPVHLADYKGKVVMVNFWATWCGPCRAELPDIVTLYDTYRARGLEVLGLSADEDGPQMVKDFAQRNGLPYTIVMADDATQLAYGIDAYPTTFVIDRDGVVRGRYVGAQSLQVLEAAVKPLLSSS
jgi:peroxiredoxin